MAQGIRVKDLEQYTGELNRDDLSIPLDGDDFPTARRITGRQLKAMILVNFQEINEQVKNITQGIDEMESMIDSLTEGTWYNEWT